MTHVSVNKGHPMFLWQRSTSIIVGCWFAGCTWKNIMWWASPAGLCPWVGDPFRKRNCTLNLSLGTLQLSCSFCCCIITWAVQMCRGAALEFENFRLFQSLHHYQRNSKFWGDLFAALACSVFILSPVQTWAIRRAEQRNMIARSSARPEV
jgi:hypothetical protein